jgi:hypothetical protein
MSNTSELGSTRGEGIGGTKRNSINGREYAIYKKND